MMAALLPLIGAALSAWFCWPCINWVIGTVAWLGSWYACVAECLPVLRLVVASGAGRAGARPAA
jgi:hypothetical protein